MYTKLQNLLTIDVVDTDGKKVDQREYPNTPLAELYPDEPVVIIDWLANTDVRPTLDELALPITYQDKAFFGGFAWGSSV